MLAPPMQAGFQITSHAWFFCVVYACAMVLLLVPVTYYLFIGWTVRRDKLFAFLNAAALAVYYTQFPWIYEASDPDLCRRFRKQFNYLYGRHHYTVPLLLFFVLSLLALFAMLHSVLSWFGITRRPFSFDAVTVAAIAGGLVWCVSDQLGRIQGRDLSPYDVYGWSFRLLLAVPFGYTLAHLAGPEMAIPMAFFLGAFPTQTLFLVARRIAVSKLSLGDQQDSGQLELERLQSVSRSNAERLQDAGISTITALAWCDPVDLTIRTNLDFNYILDCMSQALLWVYFEEKARLLFKLSLRGAHDVITLLANLQGVTVPCDSNQQLTPDQLTARATLVNMSAVIGITDAALITSLRVIASDPYAQFIHKVWY